MASKNASQKITLPYNAQSRQDRKSKSRSESKPGKRKVFLQYPGDTVVSGMITVKALRVPGVKVVNSKWRPGYKPR